MEGKVRYFRDISKVLLLLSRLFLLLLRLLLLRLLTTTTDNRIARFHFHSFSHCLPLSDLPPSTFHLSIHRSTHHLPRIRNDCQEAWHRSTVPLALVQVCTAGGSVAVHAGEPSVELRVQLALPEARALAMGYHRQSRSCPYRPLERSLVPRWVPLGYRNRCSPGMCALCVRVCVCVCALTPSATMLLLPTPLRPIMPLPMLPTPDATNATTTSSDIIAPPPPPPLPTSSQLKVEGGCNNNNWFKWENQKDEAGVPRIKRGQKCGKAADHWNRYKEDTQLMKDLGCNSYRFSVEWSKVRPPPCLVVVGVFPFPMGGRNVSHCAVATLSLHNPGETLFTLTLRCSI